MCQGCQTRTKPIARPDSGSNKRALLKFVVRQAGVEIGRQVCRGQFQSLGRGADVGRIRADEGVVPGSRQSRSRGHTWVGARQMKTETGIWGGRRLQQERVLGHRQRQAGRRRRIETD